LPANFTFLCYFWQIGKPPPSLFGKPKEVKNVAEFI